MFAIKTHIFNGQGHLAICDSLEDWHDWHWHDMGKENRRQFVERSNMAF
jgi:hypothetical protein